jgi:hypothetical protein
VETAVLVVFVGRAPLVLGSSELKDEPRAIVLVDRLSPCWLVTMALIARGASLIVGRFGGLWWVAGAHVGARLGGLLNASTFLRVAGAGEQWWLVRCCSAASDLPSPRRRRTDLCAGDQGRR